MDRADRKAQEQEAKEEKIRLEKRQLMLDLVHQGKTSDEIDEFLKLLY